MQNDYESDMIEQIREMDDAEGSLLREIVDTFLADAPERLAECDAAFAAGDQERLHRVAHTLKGSSSNLGLIGIAAAANQIVDSIRSGGQASAAEVDALHAAWERAQAIIQTEILRQG